MNCNASYLKNESSSPVHTVTIAQQIYTRHVMGLTSFPHEDK